MLHPLTEEVVWDSKWFHINARRYAADAEPHYVLNCKDYVSVIATNVDGKLLLVRQFRPATGMSTLEIPSGHVEAGQTPEEAARLELLEETGYEAEQLDFLCQLSPDTGRMGNRMWLFFAQDVKPVVTTGHQREDGVEPLIYEGDARTLVRDGEFQNALHHAALLAAIARGKLLL